MDGDQGSEVVPAAAGGATVTDVTRRLASVRANPPPAGAGSWDSRKPSPPMPHTLAALETGQLKPVPHTPTAASRPREAIHALIAF